MNADLNAVIAEPAVSHTMQNRAATQMEPGVWDKRYGVDQFVYGAAPNVHIKRTAEQYLTQPCHVVELACGEGRNVAFLAAAGHHVTAVDFSQAGLDKTMQLTRQLAGPEAAARVTPVLADILTWRPGQGKEQGADGETAGAAGDQVEQVDAVVLSFCHVPAASRAAFMQSVREMLKPGGYLLQEVFHPNQVHKGYRAKSGGPHDHTMMVELQELRSQLGNQGGEEVEAEEVEYVLQEGELHDGLGAVTRYVWRKASASDSCC